jgi:Phage P22-like portal protein
MPYTPTDRDTEPAVTDEEVWQECDHNLRIGIEAESQDRSNAEQWLEFRDGHHWPDDLYNQRKIAKRPSLTVNLTDIFCRRIVNNMRQQRPRIKVHPVGDGADVDKAQIIGGVIRHIENISNASVAYDTAGESAVNIGWGYFRIIAEYIEGQMDQEIKILPIRNAFTVYMDPSAVMPSGSDADWVIITEKMKRNEYKRLYPKAKNVEFIPAGRGDNRAQWETKTEIRLAEYYRITRKSEDLIQLSTGRTIWGNDYKRQKEAFDLAEVTVSSERRASHAYVEWFKLNGVTVIESRRVGGADDKGPLPGLWIPVVRCEGNVLDLDGKVSRSGVIKNLMDPNRMYDYWRTAETEQLALASKAPWIGQVEHFEGHGEWDDANQTPYSKLTYNAAYLEQPDGSKTPLPPPQRQPAIEVPAGFVQAAQGAQQDLMAVAGMPHEPGQDSPGAVVSGRALERRQALSDIGHFQYYDNQTQAIAQAGRVILSWIPTYYSTQRMQRIIGEDGVPSMVEINRPDLDEVKNDLSVGRYDVVMDTGPGFDTKRMEGSENMIDLMKIGPLAEIVAKAGADLVFRAIDAPYMEELADRVMPQTPEGMQKVMQDLPKRAQDVVKSAMAQLQAANQKIQQLEQDLKVGLTKTLHQDATKMAIEHLKDKRAEQDTNTDAQTKIFDTHVKSVTARDVAEINAASKLLDTHAKGGYDAEARKDELAAAKEAEKSTVQ